MGCGRPNGHGCVGSVPMQGFTELWASNAVKNNNCCFHVLKTTLAHSNGATDMVTQKFGVRITSFHADSAWVQPTGPAITMLSSPTCLPSPGPFSLTRTFCIPRSRAFVAAANPTAWAANVVPFRAPLYPSLPYTNQSDLLGLRSAVRAPLK